MAKNNWNEDYPLNDKYEGFPRDVALKMRRERNSLDKQQERYRKQRFQHFRNMSPSKMKQQILANQ